MISLRLAGLQGQLDVVRADRRPAVRDRVERLAALHRRRAVPAAVGAQERVALGVEAGQLARSRRSRRSDCAARGTRSCGRSRSSSTSTWPVLKLRWKLVASSCASHRQNSMLEKSESSAGFVALVGHRAAARFPGSRPAARSSSVSASMPSVGRADDACSPCRGGSCSRPACVRVGCQDGDQNSPLVVVAQVDVAPADIERARCCSGSGSGGAGGRRGRRSSRRRCWR